jgi:hypothetical protein
MRWKSIPDGTKKIVSKFLWFPTTIATYKMVNGNLDREYQTRWLEIASIEYISIRGRWFPNRFMEN